MSTAATTEARIAELKASYRKATNRKRAEILAEIQKLEVGK